MDITRPTVRPRRLRQSPGIRDLVRETHLHPRQLILPMFLVQGLAKPRPIASMPGVLQHSLDSLVAAAREARQAGVGAVMLFGIPQHKDVVGSEATNPAGILAEGVRALRAACPDLPIVADLCLDEFTDHGHCGVLTDDGQVDNDATLARYAEMACVLADAGAQMVGPSGMMDGQIAVIRAALDAAGHTDTIVLAYSAKFASAFFGPFRDAVQCSLQGDRRTYQEDPANAHEAIREVLLDIDEGADIVMVKPALGYLDVVAQTRAIVDVPVCAYIVSGEYAMIEQVAASGGFDRRRAIMEVHTCVARAGADLLCTYWATEVAQWLKEEL